MRLPSTAHTSRPWRIHEIAPEFRLEDVWALPTPGGPDDFPRLVHQATSGAPEDGASGVGRVVWAIRWKLGALLGWDDQDRAPERPTPRDRLPADLRKRQPGPGFEEKPFTPIYLLDDEFAAEIVNRTVHAIMHLGWVEDEDGGWRGQMGVYVKPNGLLGHAYIAAIRPFRHWLIYPPLMRKIERAWRADAPSAAVPA
jgi:Protein of unknown function (DUF2867)